MFKKLFYLLLILAGGTLIWFVFAVWVGLYSIYSYPPSNDHPEGVTLIVSRESDEPMFNSPDYRQPKKKAEPKKDGISFAPLPKGKRPIERRTIIELPYIEWTYKKSLEQPPAE
jgi:hypothetical protein